MLRWVCKAEEGPRRHPINWVLLGVKGVAARGAKTEVELVGLPGLTFSSSLFPSTMDTKHVVPLHVPLHPLREACPGREGREASGSLRPIWTTLGCCSAASGSPPSTTRPESCPEHSPAKGGEWGTQAPATGSGNGWALALPLKVCVYRVGRGEAQCDGEGEGDDATRGLRPDLPRSTSRPDPNVAGIPEENCICEAAGKYSMKAHFKTFSGNELTIQNRTV
jgi:hypothetical protein